MIFINYIINYITSKRDVLLTIHNFSDVKSLANNAKVLSSLIFPLIWYHMHYKSKCLWLFQASLTVIPNQNLTLSGIGIVCKTYLFMGQLFISRFWHFLCRKCFSIVWVLHNGGIYLHLNNWYLSIICILSIFCCLTETYTGTPWKEL